MYAYVMTNVLTQYSKVSVLYAPRHNIPMQYSTVCFKQPFSHYYFCINLLLVTCDHYTDTHPNYL